MTVRIVAPVETLEDGSIAVRSGGIVFALNSPRSLDAFAGTTARIVGQIQVRLLPDRAVVDVAVIESMPEADPAPAQVEFTGRLRTGMLAIGGETTGTEVELIHGTILLYRGLPCRRHILHQIG